METSRYQFTIPLPILHTEPCGRARGVYNTRKSSLDPLSTQYHAGRTCGCAYSSIRTTTHIPQSLVGLPIHLGKQTHGHCT